jgi:energy-converting hydrogenase Eha subunit A
MGRVRSQPAASALLQWHVLPHGTTQLQRICQVGPERDSLSTSLGFPTHVCAHGRVALRTERLTCCHEFDLVATQGVNTGLNGSFVGGCMLMGAKKDAAPALSQLLVFPSSSCGLAAASLPLLEHTLTEDNSPG